MQASAVDYVFKNSMIDGRQLMKMDSISFEDWLKILSQILSFLACVGNIAKSAPTHCIKLWGWDL